MQHITREYSNVSGTQRICRLQPLRAAVRQVLWPLAPLSIGVAGLALLQVAAATGSDDWDCRPAPDGSGWECRQAGEAPAAPQPLSSPTSTSPDTSAPVTSAPVTSAPVTSAPVTPAPVTPAAVTPLRPPPPAPARDSGDMPTPAPRGESPATPTAPSAAMRAFQAGELPDLTAPVEPRAPVQPRAPASQAAPKPATVQTFDSDGEAGMTAPADPVQQAPAPLAGGVAQIPPTRPLPPEAATITAPAAPPALADIDDGIDWERCSIGAGIPQLDIAPQQSGLPVTISADALVLMLEPQQAVFSGTVQLDQGDVQLQADELLVDRGAGEVEARGDVLLARPDIRVAGSTAHYQLATGQARAEQASYRVPAAHARGEAGEAEILGGGHSRYRDISYTTCRPGDSAWLLRAGALELDQVEGFGKARNATLRLMDIPVLYAPVFTFPIDDRRRSGVLVPTIGNSTSTGFDLSVPYYFNLAENYDLTVTPRLMSKRGLMLGGEFRFLTGSSSGVLNGEILPDDSEYEDGGTRGAASLRSQTRLGPRAAAVLNLNYLSDSDYLDDFGDSLAATSARHIQRTALLRYHGDTWDLSGRLEEFQTIDELIPPRNRPYSRLPQLLFGLETPDGLAGATYHLDAEYVNFHRSGRVRGHRVDIFPAISRPFRESWGYIEPKVGARYTAYSLTDQAAGLDDAPSHLTAMLNLDSGLYFDRSVSFFDTAATQTLEPRLYYLYVPQSDQQDQPIFDTGALDFSFDNLFRENRFNGPDRFGDANQATLALTSRLIAADSGVELLRASVGQILYFDDREVTLPGEPVANDSSSAFVGELSARLGTHWSARAGLQWDPHAAGDGNIDQALAQIVYRDPSKRLFNAAYRLRDGVTEQTDLAVFWPFSERFSLIGRHNYSLQDNRLLEALAGIEYGHCCWRLRTVLRQYSNGDGSDHNLGILVQLELNGLGRLGHDIEQTLSRSIYGYGTHYDY